MNLFQRDPSIRTIPIHIIRRIGGPVREAIKLKLWNAGRSKAAYQRSGRIAGNTRMVQGLVNRLLPRLV